VKKVRVLIIDDHTILRQGVATVLNAEGDMQTIHCGSIGEGLLIVASQLTDVVLLDIDLGSERGTDFIELARRNGFHGPILILTAGIPETERNYIVQLGVAGILLKDASVDTLAERIRECIGAPPPAVSTLVRVASPAPPLFSPRESQVLRLVIQGLANKEIATAMNSTEPIVKSILQQLFRKTSTHSRSQLVGVALENLRDQI
jgi:DNA-binding NarL/FixJ family response regulator